MIEIIAMIQQLQPVFSLLKKLILASLWLGLLLVSSVFSASSAQAQAGSRFQARSCQFLLAPTQAEFNEYLTHQILEFYYLRFRLNLLEQSKVLIEYNRDLKMTMALAPLGYFFQYYFDAISPRRIKFKHSLMQGARLFSKTFSQGVLDHPAGAQERGLLLHKLFFDMRGNLYSDTPFFDEILGLNRELLEANESAEYRNSTSEDKSQSLSQRAGIGLGAGHNFWFSKHHELFKELRLASGIKAKSIADLGCGTGRLGLMAGLMYPEMSFIGLDIYAPRIEAAQAAAKRFGFSDRIQFRVQDLLDSKQEIPVVDYYYIYGPTNSSSLNAAVVDRLEPIAKRYHFVVSSTHWDTTMFLRDRTWLRSWTSKIPHHSFLFKTGESK